MAATTLADYSYGTPSFAARLRAMRDRVFVEYWPYWAAAMVLAVLNVFEFGFGGRAWGVTTEFTRWGGHLMQLLGVDVSGWLYFEQIGLEGMPWDRGSGWINIGMLLGALIGALLSTNFKIRMPRQRIRLVQGFVGGAIAGFGARLAMGCNLGSFFSAIPQSSFHGWLFMAGLFLGTYLGTKIVLLPVFLGKPESRRGRHAELTPEPSGRSIQPTLGLVLLGLVGLGVAYYVLFGRWTLGVWLLFGVGFGFAIERGRFCFTSAFRELWITRQADLSRALALGMMVATIGMAILIYAGRRPEVQWASPGALLGGILFGIGIVVAGGCETGWMYRSAEGYVQLWMAGLGTIVGATLLAWAWGSAGLYHYLVEGWPKVALFQSIGWPAAILSTLALLAGWYLFVTWWESRGSLSVPRAGARGIVSEKEKATA
ncbi:MAG: selenium metabolism membrane protein YedE/FdhT [Chloroflexota bacterium]